MATTLASLRQRTTAVDFTTSTGGSLSAGTLYFWVNVRNRAGYNLLSDGDATPSSSGVQLTWSAGGQVTITINGGAVASAEDVREFVVSASATNDPSTSRRLASIRYRDPYSANGTSYPGEGVERSFPLTIVLDEDEHLVLGTVSQQVANTAALPTGADAVHGMIRESVADAELLRYDSEAVDGFFAADTGYWVLHNEGPSAYVATTEQQGIIGSQPQGCDRPIQSLNAAMVDEPPPYNPTGALQAVPLELWVNNGVEEDSGPTIPKGTRIATRVSVDGANQSELFANAVTATLLGEVTIPDGTLDTSLEGTGAQSLLVAGTDSSDLNGLTTPKDLDRGRALAYEVALLLDSGQLGGRIEDGASISVLLYLQGRIGTYSAALAEQGDLVRSAGGRLRILPVFGTGARRLGGTAQIGGYSFPDPGTTLVTGLQPDTANQVIAISGQFAGDVTVRQSAGDVKSHEAIRAIVSTEPGTATVTAASSAVAIAGPSESLQVTIGYPSNANGEGTIRTDYPDVVAENAEGDFSLPKVRVYVEKDGDGTWHQYTYTTVAGESQTVTISDLSAAEAQLTTANLPDTSNDNGFNLWQLQTPSVAAAVSSSNLDAGSYVVRVAAHYPAGNTALTRISHDTADGAIAEASLSYADLLSLKGQVGYTTTVADFTQPAIDANVTIAVELSDWISPGQMLFIEGGGFYRAVSRPSSTQLIATNLGYSANTVPAATISSGGKVSPSGSKGDTGESGVDGLGFRFEFDDDTSGDPLTAQVQFSSATVASVTEVAIASIDSDGKDIGALLQSITPGSVLTFCSSANTAICAIFQASGTAVATTNGYRFAVDYVDDTGTFADGDAIRFSFALSGVDGVDGTDGADGVPGAGVPYTLDGTSISSGASSGQLRLNNADATAATEAYFSAIDRNGGSVDSLVGKITINSIINVISEDVANKYGLWIVTGAIEDNGTYYSAPIAYDGSSGGAFGNLESIRLAPIIAGTAGVPGTDGVDGDDGYSGFGLDVTKSATTTAGAAAGELRFDVAAASQSTITTVYLSESDSNGANVDELLATLTIGSPLRIQDKNTDAALYLVVSATPTNNVSYWTIPVTYSGESGIITDGNPVYFSFAAKGAKGDDGSLSATSAIAITEGAEPSTAANEATLWNDGGTVKVRAESDGSSKAIGYRDPPVFNYTGTAHTFLLENAGGYVRLNNASAITATIPANATTAIPVGAIITVFQAGAGQVTFAGEGGLPINSKDGNLSLVGQFSSAMLIKVAPDEWDLAGDLA